MLKITFNLEDVRIIKKLKNNIQNKTTIFINLLVFYILSKILNNLYYNLNVRLYLLFETAIYK